MKRGIKYCGGCNPRYDRGKYVRRLEKELGVSFETAQKNEEYDEIYVFCGCTSRCADLSGLTAREFIMIDSDENFKLEERK